MVFREKPLIWLHGEIKTPPFGLEARLEAGYLLRRLQQGEKLSMPQSRPMPSVGLRCHELRINDEHKTWRIMYRIEIDSIVILEVFEKKTNQTSKSVIETCKKRIKRYESVIRR
jgi:phage-related protein